ncbi:MAG: type II toxin-antitoxin system VapB family antitoxin [Dermatophilaceae bacterium]
MGMNIKNDRVHDLARQAAERTGKSQTSVVEEALSQYLAQLDRKSDEAEAQVRRVLADFDRLLTDEDRRAMRDMPDDLYDDLGLPR